MIRRLTILLLIVGCDNSTEPNDGGICAYERSSVGEAVRCYTTWNEYKCVKENNDAINDLNTYHWFESLTCEEYCQQAEDAGREECTIY